MNDDVRTIDPVEVQYFLNELMPMQQFTVIFKKTNGEQRMLTGHLDPDPMKPKKDYVHIMTLEGWKTFYTDRVLSINTAT